VKSVALFPGHDFLGDGENRNDIENLLDKAVISMSWHGFISSLTGHATFPALLIRSFNGQYLVQRALLPVAYFRRIVDSSFNLSSRRRHQA
jgi:hypothetical protein